MHGGAHRHPSYTGGSIGGSQSMLAQTKVRDPTQKTEQKVLGAWVK
jgi:hypothetical protein